MVRYFHCGEYGEETGRPHYHCLLFNFDFHDKVYFKSNSSGDRLYTSALLSKLWPFGHHFIGAVTFESAAYVARYVMKKVTGDLADEHYVDKETGFIRPAEYVTMSRGSKVRGTGGIGKSWLEKYVKDVYPHDEKVVRGKICKPPKFYDKQLELTDPSLFVKIKARRLALAAKCSDDNTPWRLEVKRQVKEDQLKRLKRGL